MKKLVIGILATAIVSLLLSQFMPWWNIMIVGLIAGYLIYDKGGFAFLGGFLGIALLWWITAFIIDSNNESRLSTMIAEIFKAGSPIVLIIVTGIIGGLAGGFASLNGFLLKKLIAKDQ